MTLVGKELRFFVIYIIKRLYIQGYNLLKSFFFLFVFPHWVGGVGK